MRSEITSNSIQEEIRVHKTEFLVQRGFINIGTVQSIQTTGFPSVIELNFPGVYAITASNSYEATFICPEATKLIGNVINPWSIEKLIDKWVQNADVLYYGLAGAHSPRTLKSRLRDLINHSLGNVTDRGPHKGGEIIWQLKGYENFEIWIMPTGNPPEPRLFEESLIKRFYDTTGRLPFANRKF